MKSFDGEKVLVTCATSGVGRETVRLCGAQGAAVAITQRLIDDSGSVDILINDAGFWELVPTEQATTTDYDLSVLDTPPHLEDMDSSSSQIADRRA